MPRKKIVELEAEIDELRSRNRALTVDHSMIKKSVLNLRKAIIHAITQDDRMSAIVGKLIDNAIECDRIDNT